jgi:hypothetical protein
MADPQDGIPHVNPVQCETSEHDACLLREALRIRAAAAAE